VEREIGPSECAFLVAIPLSRAEFDADCGAGRDYASNLARQYGSAEYAWKRVYQGIAQMGQRVLRDVTKLGVTAMPRAGREALAAVRPPLQALVLVAHAIESPILPEEILDAPRMLERIQKDPHPVVAIARAWLASCAPALLEAKRADAASLADKLNQLLRRSQTRFQEDVQPIRRVLLEEAFPVELKAAPVVELADGQWSLPQMAESIPTDFEGTLDLSICKSISMADRLKRMTLACLAVANIMPQSPSYAMARFELVASILAKRPRRYSDAVLAVSRAMRKKEG
jgi:hypothetical protein